jgi:uncharacterized membrane protein YebE (DUF533 family)
MPPKVREPVAYRKLTGAIVEDIYTSLYRRSWLATAYNLPLKQVTLIKRAATREEALELYGH